MKNPLFLALDVDDLERANELVKQTRAFVGGFKIGPRAIMRFGPDWVKALAQQAPLFIDQKYFDIPSTMISSVRASFDLGARYCTVHAQSGAQALRELAELEAELQSRRSFKILAVTVLTSMTPHDLPKYSQAVSLPDQVLALADLVLSCGLSGLVCSANEVEQLRARHPESFLLTPGIRMSQESTQDQKRVASPRIALKAGSSALVVGRPIVDASDPAEAAKVYYEEIQKFLDQAT